MELGQSSNLSFNENEEVPFIGQLSDYPASSWVSHTFSPQGNYLTVEGFPYFPYMRIGGEDLLIADFCFDLLTDINAPLKVSRLNFSIFPNPFKKGQRLTASIRDEVKVRARLSLFDSTGRLVMSRKGLDTGDHQLNTGSFPPGIYFYRLTHNGELLGAGKLAVQ